MASWLPASAAFAQPSAPSADPPPASSQAAPEQPQPGVTVVAPTPGYRATIDRRSYSIANDLQKGTGALADVLRNVPAVQVDPDGNLSLRGDPSVTILVDGKPSALFSGPGRAQALQSMSADQYARVEVMTNPPAGVTSEGSGGVINLITKTPPKGAVAPAANETVKASLGSDGRSNVGVSGSYTDKGVSVTGGADVRRGGFSRTIRSQFGLPDPTTGALDPAAGLASQSYREDSVTLYGTLGYNLTQRDHIDASLNSFSGCLVENQNNEFQTDAVTGPFALSYTAPGSFDGHFTSLSGSVGLTHALSGDGHSLAAKLTLSQGALTIENGATYTYEAPIQSPLFLGSIQHSVYPEVDVSIDCNQELVNKAKLVLGYEGTFDWNGEDNQQLQGAVATAASADPVLSETFNRHQEVHAIYATYEQAFGTLSAQAGLRLEDTVLETDLVSASEKGRQDYLEANPNLHLDYALDDDSQMKASYSRRTQRPNIGQLDPFRSENTATLYYAGNPDLRPAITQSYELGYEFRHKTTDLQATIFYRDKTDLITQVYNDIGDDVLLATWANLGHEHDAGLELVANYELSRTLSVNASVDLQRVDADPENLGIGRVRSAFTAPGRITVNWQVTPKEFVQIGGGDSGRELTAQGYRGGAGFSNLGWRHRFDAKTDALFTIDNPFGVARRTIVTDTPTLIDIEKRKQNAVTVFLGLTFAFGSSSKSPGNFDFGSQRHETPQGKRQTTAACVATKLETCANRPRVATRLSFGFLVCRSKRCQ